MVPAEIIATVPVSPPQVYVRLNALMADPDVSARDCARVIALDPALTVRLLRVVNSSLYRHSHPIDTVERAIATIGILPLAQLVLATSVVRAFAGIPSYLVNVESFWRHSLYTGVLVRLLAAKIDTPHPETLFTAALLHDIGFVLLCQAMPERMRHVLDRVRKHSLPLEVAEHDEWGYTHAVVGGELARAWGLGEWLECLIETHHDSTYSSLCRRECALITVADHLATVQQYAIERNPLMYPLDAEVLILAGWAGPESPLDVLPLADGQYATLARALA